MCSWELVCFLSVLFTMCALYSTLTRFFGMVSEEWCVLMFDGVSCLFIQFDTLTHTTLCTVFIQMGYLEQLCAKLENLVQVLSVGVCGSTLCKLSLRSAPLWTVSSLSMQWPRTLFSTSFGTDGRATSLSDAVLCFPRLHIQIARQHVSVFRYCLMLFKCSIRW
jgi:hypothetical protein